MRRNETSINTGGGTHIDGDLRIDSGDFVGREKIETLICHLEDLQPPLWAVAVLYGGEP